MRKSAEEGLPKRPAKRSSHMNLLRSSSAGVERGLLPGTVVITSYSIHYTKLYEGQGARQEGFHGPVPKKGIGIREQIILGLAGPDSGVVAGGKTVVAGQRKDRHEASEGKRAEGLV